jgi:hypothetical protein
MKFFDTKYRIVRDKYSGYEAQYRPWWFPIWVELDKAGIGNGTNTCKTIERAREICCLHRQGKVVEHFDPRNCK